MKLEDWVKKIISNAHNSFDTEQVENLVRENLKAFIQDDEVVGIGIGEHNQLYVYVIE